MAQFYSAVDRMDEKDRQIIRALQRDGRKSNQVTVDNRQQNLTLPEGTTLEDLRALRDGMRG